MTKEQVLAVMDQLEWGFQHRRCPVCAGFNCGPNGETDRMHTATCPVPQARAAIASWPEPGEAVAWRFTDEEGKPLTDYWEVGPCGDYARGKAAKYGWTVEYAYAAPPSMAALTNPKDSDAEASLRALLAELRGLAERWMSADTNSYKHCSRALNAVLSRYPEAK